MVDKLYCDGVEVKRKQLNCKSNFLYVVIILELNYVMLKVYSKMDIPMSIVDIYLG